MIPQSRLVRGSVLAATPRVGISHLRESATIANPSTWLCPHICGGTGPTVDEMREQSTVPRPLQDHRHQAARGRWAALAEFRRPES